MELKELPIEKITSNPRQPREEFPKEELGELAGSIAKFGTLQPIIVRPTEEETYQIVAGERRWRAASLTSLKRIPAFVKDVDDRQQMAESLIENVHRKELSPIEKGRATYQLFLLNEIDMEPKELANKLNAMNVRKHQGEDVAIDATEKKILDVCENQIHKPFRAIRDWAGAVAVPKEVQKAEVKKPKEKRLSGVALERISTIPGEETQKRFYTKIKKQGMDGREASSFISAGKKLASNAREYALKPESSSTPSVMEKALELPEEDQEKALRQIDGLRLTEEEAIEHIEAMKVEVPAPPEEEWEEVRRKYQEIVEETKEKLAKPEAQKRGKLFQNWLAHSTIMGTLDTIRCPICGSSVDKLGWSCDEHDFIEIKKAMKKAEEEYQDSIGG